MSWRIKFFLKGNARGGGSVLNGKDMEILMEKWFLCRNLKAMNRKTLCFWIKDIPEQRLWGRNEWGVFEEQSWGPHAVPTAHRNSFSCSEGAGPQRLQWRKSAIAAWGLTQVWGLPGKSWNPWEWIQGSTLPPARGHSSDCAPPEQAQKTATPRSCPSAHSAERALWASGEGCYGWAVSCPSFCVH